MKKLSNIIAEVDFSIYQAMAKIHHTQDINVQDVGEMLRGVPGVSTIVQIEHNYDNNTAIMKVKIITTKTAAEGFKSFVDNSLKRIPQVKKIEIADKTIEKKK